MSSSIPWALSTLLIFHLAFWSSSSLCNRSSFSSSSDSSDGFCREDHNHLLFITKPQVEMQVHNNMLTFLDESQSSSSRSPSKSLLREKPCKNMFFINQIHQSLNHSFNILTNVCDRKVKTFSFTRLQNVSQMLNQFLKSHRRIRENTRDWRAETKCHRMRRNFNQVSSSSLFFFTS